MKQHFKPTQFNIIQDFIAKCLIKDYKKRYTVKQLLQHSFITSMNHQISQQNTSKWIQQILKKKKKKKNK